MPEQKKQYALKRDSKHEFFVERVNDTVSFGVVPQVYGSINEALLFTFDEAVKIVQNYMVYYTTSSGRPVTLRHTIVKIKEITPPPVRAQRVEVPIP